jgi:Rrf2 family protein
MALPPSFTPEVLGALAAAGLARSKAGPTGGYRLARPPNEISLLEVVEATEGDLFSGRCTLRGGPCRWDDVCAVHPSWIRVREQVRAVMTSTSLSELAAEDRRLEA